MLTTITSRLSDFAFLCGRLLLRRQRFAPREGWGFGKSVTVVWAPIGIDGHPTEWHKTEGVTRVEFEVEFFEEDEPLAEVVEAFRRGKKRLTGRGER